MLALRSTKAWAGAAIFAAVLTCAHIAQSKAQSNSSEYAPLAGAPAPGMRSAPAIPAAQALIAPTPTEAVAPTPGPESAPNVPAVASTPPAVETPLVTPPAVVATPQAEPNPAAPGPSAQPSNAEKAAEKKKAAQEKSAKKDAKGEKSAATDAAADDALPRGRIPEDGTLKNAAKLPVDDKGPRALAFIGNCLNNYDNCMQFVREQADRIPKSDLCFPENVDQVDITEKVRKFITLRPAIHSQAANRVVTEALYGIYQCKRTGPAARTAGAPKTKSAQ